MFPFYGDTNYSVPIPPEYHSITDVWVLLNTSLIISLIINPIGTYLIVYHTPRQMTTLKRQTLLGHSSMFALDITCSAIIRPRLLCPLLGAHIEGIMGYTGAYGTLYFFLFVAIASVITVANVILWKHQLLLTPASPFKMIKRHFYTSTLVMYLTTPLPMLTFLGLSYTPFEQRKELVAKKYPHLRDFVMLPQMDIVQSNDDFHFTAFLVSALMFVMFWVSFGAVVIWHSVSTINAHFYSFSVSLFFFLSHSLSPSRSSFVEKVSFGAVVIWHSVSTINKRPSSQRTRDLEMRLFYFLTLKIMAPVCFLAVPTMFVLVTAIAEIFYVQDYSNFVMFAMSSCGSLSTVIMIVMNNSYKQVLIRAYQRVWSGGDQSEDAIKR